MRLWRGFIKGCCDKLERCCKWWSRSNWANWLLKLLLGIKDSQWDRWCYMLRPCQILLYCIRWVGCWLLSHSSNWRIGPWWRMGWGCRRVHHIPSSFAQSWWWWLTSISKLRFCNWCFGSTSRLEIINDLERRLLLRCWNYRLRIHCWAWFILDLSLIHISEPTRPY